MSAGFEQRLAAVWLLLSAVTLAQLGVGGADGRDALVPEGALAAGAIGIALVKVRIIFREFMEVRHAPAWLGRMTDLWLVATAVILVVGYAAGRASGS